MAGEVIGITTLYLKGGENLNFAIPINDAKRLLLSKPSTLVDWPNEHESVKTDHEEHTPSAMAQQKMCADQAKKFFNDNDYFKSNPFNSYTNHYDAKTSVCYVLILIDKRVAIGAIADEVYDAFEGTQVGRIERKEQYDGLDHTYACHVKPLGEEGIRCETRNEFFNLVKKHFGLERP